jgi:hypothetical protein
VESSQSISRSISSRAARHPRTDEVVDMMTPIILDTAFKYRKPGAITFPSAIELMDVAESLLADIWPAMKSGSSG